MAEGRDASGALLTWLQTFAPPRPCATPPDLRGGETLAHVLHQIDPSWFDSSWRGRIREGPDGNPRTQVNNLRQVLQRVLDYWQEELGQAVAEQHVPDVSRAQSGDPQELGKLVRLVLGCAVTCPSREEHIRRIRGLEESVQHEVMAAIQELLDPEPSEPMGVETFGAFDTQSRRYYFLSQEPPEEGGEGQRCRDLELQVSHLAEENRALRELLEAEAAEAKKVPRLQAQVEELQEENYRLESGREELQVRCSHLEREARGLQVKAQELQVKAGEAQVLRDEVELLRASAARAGHLEAAVASFRGRALAAAELRRRGRALEERHLAQVRRANHLQQQLGRAQAGREQLEAARRQVEELAAEQEEAELRARKWHLEFRHLQERFQALSQEKERLLEERDALREANEELRCAQVLGWSDVGGSQGGPATPPPQNLAAEIVPAELREAVTRLRRQNRRLRLQREQLWKRLEEKEGNREEPSLPEEPPQDLEELPEEEEEEEPPRAGSGFGGPGLSPPRDPPGTPPLAPVLRLLRNQLREKDELILHLQSDWERSRAQREREEKLLVTAWYNMGLALQQHEGGEGGPSARGGAGGAQSFLAQQRLVATRRARPPPTRGRTPPL